MNQETEDRRALERMFQDRGYSRREARLISGALTPWQRSQLVRKPLIVRLREMLCP